MPELPSELADYVFATYGTDNRLCAGIIALVAENSEMRATIRSLRSTIADAKGMLEGIFGA